MKRIVKITMTLILIFLIPSGMITGQEKKNGKRIKIVVSDMSGTTVIDTLIAGGGYADSIRLKSGEVIYFNRHGNSGTVRQIDGDKKNMTVTVTSDDKCDKKIMKKMTVVACDSVTSLPSGEGDEVIIIKGCNNFAKCKGGKVVTWSSSEGDSEGENYFYVNESKASGKNGEKTFDVKVTTDEKDNSVEKIKYVIAKDGVVVSVEGNDEAKVKDLVNDIEAKLGINKEDKSKNQVVNEETKVSKKAKEPIH
jgi:hypothetical protein